MAEDPKVYIFEQQKDFLIFLNLLIEITIKHYNRFKIYYLELEKYTLVRFSQITEMEYDEVKKVGLQQLLNSEIIRINYLKNKEKIKLKYIDYKSLEDKLFTPKNILLNAFADRTKNGVSYWRFRDEYDKAVKKGTHINFVLEEFDESTRRIFNDLGSVRNYEHHLTDAKFIEWRVFREKQIEEALSQGINYQWPSEVIEIDLYEQLEIEWLWQLYLSMKELFEDFGRLLQLMKKDYTRLIGKSMRVDYRQMKETLSDHHFEISLNGIKRHQGKKK